VKQVRLGFPHFASKLAKKRWWVMHVVSSQRSRESESKDGRFIDVGCSAVKSFQTTLLLDLIFILAHRGILVLWFSLYIET
jgi:hypothetical protein